MDEVEWVFVMPKQCTTEEVGVNYNIGDLVNIIKKVTCCNKRVTQEESRIRPPESEVRELLPDAGKLHAASGWAATTELKDGLKKTADWWRERIKNVRPDARYMT